MARDESDREDLLAEASALVERLMVQVDGWDDAVVAGFRRNGATSFFFGADPVYQFNAAGELRRAFANGCLYKAVQGQLTALRRERTATEVQLLSRPLTAAETNSFLTAMDERLLRLRAAIISPSAKILGQVPVEVDVLDRVAHWLAKHPWPTRLASSPSVGGAG